MSRSTDPLFQFIRAQLPQRVERALDAGTGSRSLGFLLEDVGPASLDAVTADEAIKATLEEQMELGPGHRIRVGRLSDPLWLAETPYDLILADYLLGAVERCEPYRELEVLRAVVDRLAPGGLLAVVGWQPMELTLPSSPLGELVLELERCKQALRHLTGAPRYRELPDEWVASRLTETGLQVEPVHRFDNLFHARAILGYQETLESLIERVGDYALARSFSRWVNHLLERARKQPDLEPGAVVGWDYVICARR